MKLMPELYVVAYFLSRCGSPRAEGLPAKPPSQLSVKKWNQAFELFRASLGQGRSEGEFRNSLKNARDLFDGRTRTSGRSGWRQKEAGPPSQRNPRELTADAKQVLLNWESRTNEQLWLEVKKYVSDGRVPASTFAGRGETTAGGADETFWEGQEVLRLHRQKERNRRAVEMKKRRILAAQGKLLCEVCDFDFAEFYGSLGAGFAECHHRIPLAELQEKHRLRLKDLSIVCANCHRMLHQRPFHTIENLRRIVFVRRSLRKAGGDKGRRTPTSS